MLRGPSMMNSLRHDLRGVCGLIALAAVILGATGCSSAPSKDPSDNLPADKLYEEAREEQANGNFDRAAKMYERLEGKGAGTVLGQQAQLERAYLLYQSGDKADALSTIDRFIKVNPMSPAIDYAIYLRALINFNDNLGFLGKLSRQDLSERDQQAARDSYESFKQLRDLYPNSRYAADAQERMGYIINTLAQYEVHVARYYYRRGAYVAAANRAQAAITEFQYSPATEEALSILARSYDKLGLETLRDDTERVLRTNYPKSALLSGEGINYLDKPWWQLW
jgi:outer membrane protein assembly factor BamD